MAAANEFRSAALQATVARSAASMARRTPPGPLPASRDQSLDRRTRCRLYPGGAQYLLNRFLRAIPISLATH